MFEQYSTNNIGSYLRSNRKLLCHMACLIWKVGSGDRKSDFHPFSMHHGHGDYSRIDAISVGNCWWVLHIRERERSSAKKYACPSECMRSVGGMSVLWVSVVVIIAGLNLVTIRKDQI